jgi:hypothetical protein
MPMIAMGGEGLQRVSPVVGAGWASSYDVMLGPPAGTLALP